MAEQQTPARDVATRRIFGLETEYGITCSAPGGRAMSADEAARYLFRTVVAWGRSSNVFLRNGARLYLDVGSHPEYATAETDDVRDAVVQDAAGVRILQDLLTDAHTRMREEGVPGRLHLLRNNLDSHGNSFGCHENYLIRRRADFARTADVLVPFFVTRQILTGAGHVLAGPKGPRYCFSQRADHIWETVSSATTRSRPIINTRDEPHADADSYRRLHVIVGDSSMAEPTTMLKLGTTDLVLRMLESGVHLRDVALENPVRAIRDISHDLTGRAPLRRSSGASTTAIDVQAELLARAQEFVRGTGDTSERTAWTLDLWERGLAAVADGDHHLVDTELDWAIKERLVTRYRERAGVPLDDPKVARLLLAYHDISPEDGLLEPMVRKGLVQRLTTPEEVGHAAEHPPATTRARLRGDFVRAAQEARRDHTVDWVHLKINDVAQRTVLCSDPFRAHDERVDRLIASMRP
ncbi:Pup--protein ligase [Litorihabitans aurantiacus]|uniref:Pup--protein ligase n=1 Tax=Litorihabitans aurantiacus TaxID=1930061 RepID=A0AA37UTR8_9MICO|nr:Pup--protein ligase [Litorihabitans aurantiacus]GMA31115.1 Pup--protein ligase [Litorihabitans aurantiacus]